MKYFFITILLAAIIGFEVQAQKTTLKDEEATEELSKKVVTLFKDNKISEVFKELNPYWYIPQNEIDNVETKTIQQLNLVKDRIGKPFGMVKIKESKIGDFALSETYFIRYQYTPIRLLFIYYKNEEGWTVNSFKWETTFADEFK